MDLRSGTLTRATFNLLLAWLQTGALASSTRDKRGNMDVLRRSLSGVHEGYIGLDFDVVAVGDCAGILASSSPATASAAASKGVEQVVEIDSR